MVSLRIVFLGTPAFAVPSLEALIRSRHRVVGVVSQPDRPKGRGQQVQATPTKQTAEAHGIPVIQPAKIKDEAFLQAIRDLRPDLGVVVAFGRLLPDALLAIPRLGMINVHASVLPRYRGAAPIQRAVLAGDAETGVTIMRVVSELDAGPMFSIATVPIPPDATSGDMEGVLARVGAAALLPVVDALAEGRAVETPQADAAATHAAKITKAEGTIDWRQPARVIHNVVRGLQPWPLASTTLNGERLVIRRTALDAPGGRPGARSTDRHAGVRSTDPHAGARSADFRGARDPHPDTADNQSVDLAPGEQTIDLAPGERATDLAPAPRGPGTIVRARGDELVVACGDGTTLWILELQPEGRRTMTAREFLAGRGALDGTRLGT